MEEKNDASPRESAGQKNTIETLSKEEIITKYKGLLNIAKKAKQAKDEFAEENRKLKDALSCSETQKEADKKALLTMKEMLEEFTQNKLELTTQLSELQRQQKVDQELQSQLQIENESLKRQLGRLTEENESLLGDIDRMEQKLQRVNVLGQEQKKDLEQLELNIVKLKEAESENENLKQKLNVALTEKNDTTVELEQLQTKYQNVKEINSEQRKKFNSLKDRFIDVHRKLKSLKECKCVLLETQHEYADSVTKWQLEIIKASQLLCGKMNALETENKRLKSQMVPAELTPEVDIGNIARKLAEIERLGSIVCQDQQQQQLEQQRLTEELQQAKESLQNNEIKLCQALEENERLKLNSSTTIENEDSVVLDKKLEKKIEEVEYLKTQLKENEVSYDSLNNKYNELNDLWKENELARQALEAELSQLKDYAENFKKLTASLAETEAVLESLQVENATLKQSLTESEAKLSELNEIEAKMQKQADDINTIEAEKSKILAELQNILAEKQDLSSQLNKMQSNSFEGQENLETLERTNNDLKERLEANEAKLEAKDAAIIELQQSNEDLQARYQLKEREHADLLDEMRELNEALKGRGDVISRQQEKQKELINDLKNALQKQTELESAVAVEKQAATEKSTQLTQATAKLTELENELQSLRSQEANVDAQSDILSTSTISRAEELNRLRELDDGYEEKYNKLRGLAAKLKKKLQEQTAYVNEMEQQLSGTATLRKELEEANAELAKTQQELATLKSENQKLKSSRKQANVLNLEIDAAEKSLADVSAKLQAKSNELDALNETLTTKENTNVQLRKEISILEAAKDAEVVHGKQLKEQIDRMQTQVKDAVHSQQLAITQSKELEQSVEKYKLELEELHLQLANSTSKHDTILAQTSGIQESLAAKLQTAEEKIKELETNLRNRERACEDLRVEYIDYKVKAQAVLRKNQSKETSRERELEEELVALRASEQQLQAQAQNQNNRNEQLEKQIEMLQEDNESMQRRSRELMSLVEELRQQNDGLAQENQRGLLTQQDVLIKHRQQIDNMDAYHKTQIQQMQQQIEQFQIELSKARRQPTTIGAAANTTHNSGIAATTTTLPTNISSSTEQSKIDFLLMEREAAEGSEEAAETLAQLAAKRKISTTSRRSQHDFMPLDELLNTPFTAISDKVVTTRSIGRGSSVNEEIDDDDVFGENAQHALQATKERLQIQESRVRHLTALLAENEQDLAKLTQMNDMLKEELRRQERSEEREQHMHNSEYLKNVFLKFLTLNNGDERMRLVPVLNTILKLSRNEVEMLSCVAKGQKISNDVNNRGWGSFLTAWGGGGGGGANNNN